MKKGLVSSTLASILGVVAGCGVVSDSERDNFNDAVYDVVTSPGPSFDPYVPPVIEDVELDDCRGGYPIRVVYHNGVSNRNNLLCNPFEGAKVLQGATISGKPSFGLDNGLILEWDHSIDRLYVSFEGKPSVDKILVFSYEKVNQFKPINYSSNWPSRIPRIDGGFIAITHGETEIDNNYPLTDYKITIPRSRYVGVFNNSDKSFIVKVVKDSGFNFGANAIPDLPDYITNPGEIDSPSSGGGGSIPVQTVDRYVDEVFSGGPNVLGRPDGIYSYIGFGDLLDVVFRDNVPLNGIGNDIRIHTELARADIKYTVFLSSSIDFKDFSGVLLRGSRDIDADLGGLRGSFSGLNISLIVDPNNESGPLGIDAIESLHNQ